MSGTAYAKRSQYKPIDFFFRGVVDAKSKTKKIVFVDAFQVLNDRFLGRMSACNYFVIAEDSVRINELNLIAFDELKNYRLVMRENFYIPDNVVFCIAVTSRFLESDEEFDRLLAALKTNGYKRKDLVLSFFASSLALLDDAARKRFVRLKRSYKICVSAYGEDYNSLDIFADFGFDYLRCEGQYFDTAPKKKKLLAMLTKLCASNKIALIMEGVDAPSQYARFKREGVKLMTGKAVSKLSRWVTNEFLGLSEPAGDVRTKYEAKLAKELAAQEQKEKKELESLRKAAAEKLAVGENIAPTSPRPEIEKSPYRIRLEQQRQEAARAAAEMLEEQRRLERERQERLEQPLIDTNMRFQGDVQSALALSAAYENKDSAMYENDSAEYEAEENVLDNSYDSGDADLKNDIADSVAEGEKEQHSEDSEKANVVAPTRPIKNRKEAKRRKPIRPDFVKEEKLYNEYRNESLFGELSLIDGGAQGFGVTMRIKNSEQGEPDLVGSYNERGQWVDEDGNIYNGYFDVEGKWVEYEKFDDKLEGHYNELAQWVDNDGNVYDGYFDEQGKWIDYTYTDAEGETVDNGYFDDKLGKWVPYGYFDEDGVYHKL